MTDWPRSKSLMILAATLFAILVAGQSARAQQNDDDDDEDEAPAAQQPAMFFGGFVMNDAQFDQWVFGNMGVANAGAARTKLESLLTLHVEDLERNCKLTPLQKKKLLLAGHGDIKRFFDQIDALRKKFVTNKNDQNAFQQLWQEVQPFRNAFTSGFFGADTIYTKAIKATLSPEQTVRHEEVAHERLLYRYWARVDLAMELINNEVGFTDEQRQKLVKLLKEETKPPLRMGENDYYVVLYQLGKVPEAKMKPIFEDYQWKFLKRQIDQGRGMGMFLKQNGFVPADEPPQKEQPTRIRVIRKKVG